MKSNATILIAEPNTYFSLGFTQGIMAYFTALGIHVSVTHQVVDKDHADLVFLAAEQEGAYLRYLTQRHTSPAHQRIFLIKEKPSQCDAAQFKHLDGIFYRHQSLDWALQIVTQSLPNNPQPTMQKNARISRRIPLTEREKEILCYLARGQRSCEISRALRLSQKTVSGHKRNAMGKLGISRSPDLNYWLLHGGMGQLPSAIPTPNAQLSRPLTVSETVTHAFPAISAG
ncbi:MAG: LuxR C-terminal-related transcriptional regulator [Serratia marcescens]|nr:helix-turn-helix transcriptional regulator [Serratia marcescens]EJC6395443.1 helix-turn-helix transcriptional regulator [Serratia marcescens]MDU7466740.1 LuxR C-terminal-related transcriptional regulator [Serratia marcescens]HEJ7007229.1 helix-turn-helix transcriptional regulator [Serratia marcescens]